MHLLVFLNDTEKTGRQKKLEDLLQELPVSMHERAYRYTFERDAFNYVLGRLLLKKGLDELNMATQLSQIQYQNNGKPYLDVVSFSISHTDDRVICALSIEGQLGIDIEKIKPVTLEHFKPWFTPGEWDAILAAADPLRQFYRYWTRKESIIKALGVSLSYLHQIELETSLNSFSEGGQKWYLQELDLGDGFIGAVCSEHLITQLAFKVAVF